MPSLALISAHGWTKYLSLCCGIILNFADFPAPAATRHGEPEPILVLVYDYAGLPDANLRNVIEVAGMLLSRAGIPVHWARCRGARPAYEAEPCTTVGAEDPVMLRIVANCAAESSRESTVLGNSITPGRYVLLCAGQIQSAASNLHLNLDILMAYVATHEIGHLLLGPEHRDFGIMRAVWGKSDAQLMANIELCFTKAEKQAMRTAWLAALKTSADVREDRTIRGAR